MSYSFYKEKEFVNTPKGVYPKAWIIDKFDTFMTLEYGKGLSESMRREGPYPVFGSNGIVGYHDEKLVDSPGIVVGRKGTIGAVTRSLKDFWPIDTTFYVKLKTNEIDWNWLYSELVHLNLPKLSSADVVPGLKRELVNNLILSLPALAEQKKIAEVLGVVDCAIELADRVVAQTQRLKRGLMQQLLTRGIGHTETKQTPIGNLPKDWDVVKFDDANERIFVGIATSSTKHFVTKGIPLIRNQNIKETGVDLSDLIYISKEFADANKAKALKENDIVTVRTGVPGLSSRVTKEMEGWQTFTTLISRPRLDDFDPNFLVYALNSPICKNQVARLQFGLAQQNLNVGSIVKLYVPKPPKTEQVRIAERIRVIYAKQRLEQESFERLKRIKQGLMDLLLTGKVRIKVD